eukprot:755372-Hanusia_phi.AAC.1
MGGMLGPLVHRSPRVTGALTVRFEGPSPESSPAPSEPRIIWDSGEGWSVPRPGGRVPGPEVPPGPAGKLQCEKRGPRRIIRSAP